MTRHLFLSTLTLGLAILCRPTEASERIALDPARKAAILPEASFVAHLDVAALEDSALVKTVLPLEENEALARVASATGLAASDILDVLVSAKSDGIEIELTEDGRRLSRVPGIMAVSLSRSVAAGELRAGLERAWPNRRELSSSKLGEAEIVEVAAASPEEPAFYAATSRSGTVVFLSSDRPTLEGALARERDGRYAPLPPTLEELESSLTPGHQAYFVLLTPPALRDRLKRPGEGGRPPTMVERVFEPFSGLESLALAASMTGDARLELLGDLGDEVAARQADELLRSFVLPNLLRALSTRLGAAQLPGDAVTVTSAGSLARVSIRLRTEDIEALLAARAAEGSEPPSK